MGAAAAAASATVAGMLALRRLAAVAPQLGRRLRGRLVRVGQRWAQRRAESQLPLLAEVVARELRAGTPLPQAVVEASLHPDLTGLRPQLVPVVRRWHGGEEFVACLAAWPAPSEAAQLLLAALRLGADAGGDRARLLEQVAATLHERMALRAELHSAAAQARSSALLLSTAPVAFGVLFLAVDPGLGRVALGSVAGRVCVGVGLVLGAVGWWWGAMLIGRVRP
jgi:tight adherence protein B